MVSPTEPSPPTLIMSKITSSYAVKLSLYTGSEDAPGTLNSAQRSDLSFKKHLGRDYLLQPERESFFECRNGKVISVSPNGACDQVDPYVIYLPEKPQDPVYWRWYSRSAGVLADGQELGFATSHKHSDKGVYIHNLYGCVIKSKEGPHPSRSCGPIFESLLQETPYLEDRFHGVPCKGLGLRCHLCIPLPLLWLLAAVQTKAEVWSDVLPGIIQDGTLRSHDDAAPRDKLRVVALYAPGLDYEQKVFVPPLLHDINWNGSSHSSS